MTLFGNSYSYLWRVHSILNNMNQRRLLVLLLCAAALLSCEKAPTADEFNGSAVMPFNTLYIYGGENGDVFLGKLNASKYDSESIWNEYGTYGNKRRSTSIWNANGDYGNEYRSCCPFNEYATYPPGLYDESGSFFGYFTVNKAKFNRASYELTDIICENYKEIRDDVSGWYDKIFLNH